MMKKKLIPCLYMRNRKAVRGFTDQTVFAGGDLPRLCRDYNHSGADMLLVFDLSATDDEHEEAIHELIRVCGAAELPVACGGRVRRLEDVKKILYAGCQTAVLNFSRQDNVSLAEEAAGRFGKGKLWASCFSPADVKDNREILENHVSAVLCPSGLAEEIAELVRLPLILLDDSQSPDTVQLLSPEWAAGLTGRRVSDPAADLAALKRDCLDRGLAMDVLESALSWSEFKVGSDGLAPVIVQDYKTDEVLMLAYMNAEAFQATLETGLMTYWSRSRGELWVKGLTSGHFQYVKSLEIDCDQDTLLAKVSQVGAACHTGNRSCFYRNLVKKEYDDTNPLRVMQSVYDVIADRKVNRREGSYTNYLFDKGIDKILKKCGEECTEMVIAAKNPDKEEIKYEISDFLYHMMVLMVETGVTWDEITRELSRR